LTPADGSNVSYKMKCICKGEVW